MTLKKNKCPKGIGLETIFRNILWENDKTINFRRFIKLVMALKKCQKYP